MKLKIAITILILTFFGCNKKNETSFIGKYETIYASHGYAGFNDLNYYDFGRISIEIFEAEGKIKGHGSIDVLDYRSAAYKIGSARKSADFDLVDLRVKGDTLFFEITNQILALQSKKPKGGIIRSDISVTIAVDENFTPADGLDKSPCYVSVGNGLVYYRESTTIGNALNDKLKELNDRLDSPKVKNVLRGLDWERMAIQRSIDRVKSYQR